MQTALLSSAHSLKKQFDEASARWPNLNSCLMLTTTKRSGVTHIHPLVKVERESRTLFAKIWGQMHLGFSPEIDGRIDLRLGIPMP